MKKLIVGSVSGLALSILAAGVSLKWEFRNYAESIPTAEDSKAAKIDATVFATSEAELNVDSFPLGFIILCR